MPFLYYRGQIFAELFGLMRLWKYTTALDLLVQHVDAPGLGRLTVASIHGALWLQTHFPKKDWNTLLSGQACFAMDCLSDLLNDARTAGLKVTEPIIVES